MQKIELLLTQNFPKNFKFSESFGLIFSKGNFQNINYNFTNLETYTKFPFLSKIFRISIPAGRL